jgi:hypothetical protein
MWIPKQLRRKGIVNDTTSKQSVICDFVTGLAFVFLFQEAYCFVA